MTRQLAVLVHAGIPLVEALAALVEQVEHERLKRVISEVRQRVNEGASLADALAAHPKVFSTLYVNMIRAGESSGALDVVLVRLADFTESQARLRVQDRGHHDLPGRHDGDRRRWCWASSSRWSSPRSPRSSRTPTRCCPGPPRCSSPSPPSWPTGGGRCCCWSALGDLGLPPLEGQHRPGGPAGTASSSPCRSSAGSSAPSPSAASPAPWPPCSRAACRCWRPWTSSRTWSATCGWPRSSSRPGSPSRRASRIAAPLKRSGEFPPLVHHMVAVGERSGSLEEMLGNVADAYEDQVDTTVAALTSLLEPLMIVAHGRGGGLHRLLDPHADPPDQHPRRRQLNMEARQPPRPARHDPHRDHGGGDHHRPHRHRGGRQRVRHTSARPR